MMMMRPLRIPTSNYPKHALRYSPSYTLRAEARRLWFRLSPKTHPYAVEAKEMIQQTYPPNKL